MAELLCPTRCPRGGFRVPGNYFETHRNFAPGICPKCGLVPDVVKDGTNEVITGARLDERGRVVIPAAAARKGE